MAEILAGLAVILGASCLLAGSVGVLRLRGFYRRIHPPTIAAPTGVAFLLAAAALTVSGPGVPIKAGLALLFISVTSPFAAHLLGRAAYRAGVAPDGPLEPDDLAATWPGRRD